MMLNDIEHFDMETLYEKYVGTGNFKKEFETIESEMRKLIAFIKTKYVPLKDRLDGGKNPMLQKTNPEEVNRHDSNKMIERMFKKIFNLKEFQLFWMNMGIPNAMTPPKTFTFMNRGQDKDGNFSNPKLYIGSMMDINLVVYCNLNEKELIGVILHEIGHNFFNSIFQTLGFLQLSVADIMYKSSKAVIDQLADQLIEFGLNDVFSLNKLAVKRRQFMQNFLNKHFPGIMAAHRLLGELTWNLVPMMKMPLLYRPSQLVSIFRSNTLSLNYFAGYSMEKFSDKLATDFGYGLPLATGLAKLRTFEGTLGQMVMDQLPPAFTVVTDLIDLQMEMMQTMTDMHPTNQNRIRTGLDQLRREYKRKGISPEMQAEIKKQIDEYEHYYYEIYLKADPKGRNVVRWGFSMMVEKVFGGKLDPRELFYALDPHKYK